MKDLKELWKLYWENPILFATTEEFLRRFGVGSLEELPRLDDEKIRTFEREAAEEAEGQLTLGV